MYPVQPAQAEYVLMLFSNFLLMLLLFLAKLLLFIASVQIYLIFLRQRFGATKKFFLTNVMKIFWTL